MSHQMTRRLFVGSVGAATVAPASMLSAAAGKSMSGPENPQRAYRFFNATEAQFIESACERLIPSDELGPGALGTGVPNYLDSQLGGAWGAGERLYRAGPWMDGSPSQGYQLPFTPAELFHNALRAILQDLSARGTPFNTLPSDAQDAYLKSLEGGATNLNGVPSGVFFSMLLDMTVEGFFSDPVYGGNRDMAAWRMIGFPGAYADYYEAIDRHGDKYEREPMSLGEDRRRHIHPDPNIPAKI